MTRPYAMMLLPDNWWRLAAAYVPALLLAMAILSIGMGAAQDWSNYAACSRYALEQSHTPPASTAFTRYSTQPYRAHVVGTSADTVATGLLDAIIWPKHNIRSYQFYFTRCLWGR